MPIRRKSAGSQEPERRRKWLYDYVEKMSAEAGGVFCSVGLDNLDICRILAQGLDLSTPLERCLVDVISQFMDDLLAGTCAPECLLCDQSFAGYELPPLGFGVLMPHCLEPQHLLVSGICQACVEREPNLGARVAAKFVVSLPDVRVLSLVHWEVGHA